MLGKFRVCKVVRLDDSLQVVRLTHFLDFEACRSFALFASGTACTLSILIAPHILLPDDWLLVMFR